MTELAVISESRADEDGLFAFASGILGRKCVPIQGIELRTRGWDAVVRQLRPAIGKIAYRTQPTALVLVVDGNGSAMEENDPKCRLIQLRQAAAVAQRQFQQFGRNVPVIIGVAFPAIEAWWLAPGDPDLSEAHWRLRGKPNVPAIDKNVLKQRLYGRSHGSEGHRAECQRAAARHAAAHIEALLPRFPHGLQPFVAGLRALR